MKIVVAYFLTLILPLACGGESNAALNEAPSVEIAASETVSDNKSIESTDVPQESIETKIIKTSTLRFETSNLNDS